MPTRLFRQPKAEKQRIEKQTFPFTSKKIEEIRHADFYETPELTTQHLKTTTKQIILFLFALLVSGNSSLASVNSNFSLIDSLSQQAFARLCSRLDNSAKLRPRISDHPAQWLLRQNLQRAFEVCGFQPHDSSAPVLTIGVADCAVRYLLHASERDSLLRAARIEIRASLGDKIFDAIILESSDAIARSDVAMLENPRYDFCSSAVPVPPRSTWDDVVEPLIILTALATTVVLLFTVRSQ